MVGRSYECSGCRKMVYKSEFVIFQREGEPLDYSWQGHLSGDCIDCWAEMNKKTMLDRKELRKVAEATWAKRADALGERSSRARIMTFQKMREEIDEDTGNRVTRKIALRNAEAWASAMSESFGRMDEKNMTMAIEAFDNY